ncbi:13758_t:CDS:2 [Ambispora leptoticha]|uniref:13758_t:CDS:1 n=1 Tax=Ambispora leptoticha TaxID=144679 RepID=A0A9N8VWQ8_9GLOM|nr:13758_t:CDS:2 [Ambispora leptoticha]
MNNSSSIITATSTTSSIITATSHAAASTTTVISPNKQEVLSSVTLPSTTTSPSTTSPSNTLEPTTDEYTKISKPLPLSAIIIIIISGISAPLISLFFFWRCFAKKDWKRFVGRKPNLQQPSEKIRQSEHVLPDLLANAPWIPQPTSE